MDVHIELEIPTPPEFEPETPSIIPTRPLNGADVFVLQIASFITHY